MLSMKTGKRTKRKEKIMSEFHHKHRDGRYRPEPKATRQDSGGKQRMRVRAKDTPGVICIERHTHDEAIVISGSLIVDIGDAELGVWIAQELEAAAHKIRNSGGVVGHIKATLDITSTSTMSVIDDKVSTKEPLLKRAQITLSAIVSDIVPEEAVDIVRKALAAVRLRLRQNMAQREITVVPEVHNK